MSKKSKTKHFSSLKHENIKLKLRQKKSIDMCIATYIIRHVVCVEFFYSHKGYRVCAQSSLNLSFSNFSNFSIGAEFVGIMFSEFFSKIVTFLASVPGCKTFFGLSFHVYAFAFT